MVTTVVEYGTAEALRLVSSRRVDDAAAAQAAARRAPGIKAAAEALCRIVGESEELALRSLPSSLRAEVTACAAPSESEPLVGRMVSWLRSNPHALLSCKTPGAALAAAAPIAMYSVQCPTTAPRNLELEAACKAVIASNPDLKLASTRSAVASARAKDEAAGRFSPPSMSVTRIFAAPELWANRVMRGVRTMQRMQIEREGLDEEETEWALLQTHWLRAAGKRGRRSAANKTKRPRGSDLTDKKNKAVTRGKEEKVRPWEKHAVTRAATKMRKQGIAAKNAMVLPRWIGSQDGGVE